MLSMVTGGYYDDGKWEISVLHNVMWLDWLGDVGHEAAVLPVSYADFVSDVTWLPVVYRQSSMNILMTDCNAL